MGERSTVGPSREARRAGGRKGDKAHSPIEQHGLLTLVDYVRLTLVGRVELVFELPQHAEQRAWDTNRVHEPRDES